MLMANKPRRGCHGAAAKTATDVPAKTPGNMAYDPLELGGAGCGILPYTAGNCASPPHLGE